MRLTIKLNIVGLVNKFKSIDFIQNYNRGTVWHACMLYSGMVPTDFYCDIVE